MNNYIKRIIKNKKYFYFYNNERIIDKNILDKIDKIYIAPAYKNVKIYLDSDILATGINNAGRKQYIYSENMKKKREIKKYKQLNNLSDNILKLKERIKKDLLNKEFTKDKLIALILKIMDLCNFRVGNKIYEKKYGSYGLTTLHKKHMEIKKDMVKINFIGKKGVNNCCIIKNKPVQEIIKNVYKLSNNADPYIFSIDYNNEKINIKMNDLNNYLKIYNITCKDLRTWNANIIFLKRINFQINNLDSSYYEKDDNKKLKIREKIVRESVKETAILLHHTPSICKSSYILKKIIIYIEKNNNIINDFTNTKINYEKYLKKFL
jgi:DNA topoisomerase-1